MRHGSSESKDKDDFYGLLERTIKAFHSGDIIILTVDLNAQSGPNNTNMDTGTRITKQKHQLTTLRYVENAVLNYWMYAIDLVQIKLQIITCLFQLKIIPIRPETPQSLPRRNDVAKTKFGFLTIFGNYPNNSLKVVSALCAEKHARLDGKHDL